MTRAIDIITDALQEIGVVGSGQSPSAEDADLCLRRLNQIIQTWSNARLTIPYLREISVPLDGSQEYTIGPAGDVVASRPVKVVDATWVSTAGNEEPVDIISSKQWGEIFDKGTSSDRPSYIWYESTTPEGTLHVYPRATSGSLTLDCQTLLTSFDETSTDVDLPEGYEAALFWSLAKAIQGPFRTRLTVEQQMMAAGAMSAIKRTNAAPLLLSVDGPGYEYKIERGY